MGAFDKAWHIVKGLGREIGADGTPCPQCGERYDVDGDDWNEVVGYMGETKTGLGQYICFDCDLEFNGPKGTGEFIEQNPDNWTVEDGITVSPMMQGGDLKTAFEQFMGFVQDRVGQGGCDEAKKHYIDSVPNRIRQQIANEVMPMTCDDFIQFMERTAEIGPLNPQAANAAKGALEIYRRMGGMDEGMA